MRVVDRPLLAPGDWDAFVERHPFGWFWHTEAWLDYSVAYRPGAVDRSFALVEGDRVAALVPLVQEGDAFTVGGHPGPQPLVAPTEWRAGACDVAAVRQVSRLAREHGAARWAVRTQPVPDDLPPMAAPGWSETSELRRDGWTTTTWQSFVLDLRPDVPALWAKVRKSYHSLVRRAEREYRVGAFAAPWAVELAHGVHAAAAGRETRPQATWDMMAQWAEQGHVLVALALDERREDPGRVRGMALAIRYKTGAYYASGATLDRDLSHALVWRLATTLRCGGATEFEVGWAERPGDSDKDRAVAFFKSGFGGARWTVTALETRLA